MHLRVWWLAQSNCRLDACNGLVTVDCYIVSGALLAVGELVSACGESGIDSSPLPVIGKS